MRSIEEVKNLLAATLCLGERGQSLRPDTVLLGGLPELDSMAVIQVIAALEDEFDIRIEDEDISADTFATLGSLATYIDAKLMR